LDASSAESAWFPFAWVAMAEHIKTRLLAKRADLLQRAEHLRRCRFFASADALMAQAWAVEAQLNRAGVWL